MSAFEVMSRKCDQCLLTPARIVSAARMREIVKTCRKRDVSFICHKSPEGREIACRGHFDTGVGQMSRIAERLGMLLQVDPQTLDHVRASAVRRPPPGRSEASGKIQSILGDK